MLLKNLGKDIALRKASSGHIYVPVCDYGPDGFLHPAGSEAVWPALEQADFRLSGGQRESASSCSVRLPSPPPNQPCEGF
eukprot:13010996-Alexandrium_andersonii.AAC.1